MESDLGTHGAEVASSPLRDSAHVVRGDVMKHLIGDIMGSRTIRLWSEIRTFKTLYEVTPPFWNAKHLTWLFSLFNDWLETFISSILIRIPSTPSTESG